MKNKSITLVPGEDDLLQTQVKLIMSNYYKEFLQDLTGNPKDKEERFRAGVSCVVWGAFYLEAAVNHTIQMVLEDGTTGLIKSAEMVLPFVERSSIEKKFEFVLGVLMKDEKKKKMYTGEIMALFRIRNRLAHFNESPDGVPEENMKKAKDLSAKIDVAFNVSPKIVNDMSSVSVDKRRKIILEIGNWLENSIFEYYKQEEAAKLNE